MKLHYIYPTYDGYKRKVDAIRSSNSSLSAHFRCTFVSQGCKIVLHATATTAGRLQ